MSLAHTYRSDRSGGDDSRRWTHCIAFVGGVVFAMLCAAGPAGAQLADPPWFIDEAKLPFTALEGTTTSRFWGVMDVPVAKSQAANTDGGYETYGIGRAGYRIEIPENWNGELVLYAHGYRGSLPELTVSNPELRPYLIANGYAWAASSYDANEFNAQSGVDSTDRLRKKFSALTGARKPKWTWVTGRSMGGGITVELLESTPHYDGGLPVCGAVADRQLFDWHFDWVMAALALADVPAPAFPFPTGAEWNTLVADPIKANLGAPWPVLNAQGEKLKRVAENLSGGPRPGFDAAFARWQNVNPYLVGGDGRLYLLSGNTWDNTDRVYRIESDPTAPLTADEIELNHEVFRLAADRRVARGRNLAIPPISGRPRAPVVGLAAIGDLFVPFSAAQEYVRRAEARGRGDRVVYRAIRETGHCTFTLQELQEAFADMVTWAKTGVKPSGDAILDPAAVASPSFGCAFTRQQRPGFDGC